MEEKLLYTPSNSRQKKALITSFINRYKEHIKGNSFNDLYQWSINNKEKFWSFIWDFTDIIAKEKGSTILKRGKDMISTEFFPQASLNFAENLLRYKESYKTALIFRGENNQRRQISYRQLYNLTAKIQASLLNSGLKKGDRVCAVLPNCPETIALMLAVTASGAIWTSASPDFGVEGILDRFGQINPKFLFFTNGYIYKGQEFLCEDKALAIKEKIPSIEKLIFIDFLKRNTLKQGILLDDFLDSSAKEVVFCYTSFNHPIYIMYSSGTTGKPKCIVHGAGGTLIEHLKELMLHTDIKIDDVFFYQTTCGWMMWNWLVSGLALGATLVLYDGFPLAEEGRILLRIAEEEKISIFGTNAKYLSLIEKQGIIPKKEFNLQNLKTILSTGSVLLPESFDYVYSSVKEDVLLSSISGGTDIIGCFALGCPILPVYKGELQCRSLGLQVEVFNEQGKSVINTPGELVCTDAFPSMPLYFWNDPDNKKYINSYFNYYKGVWRHGDWVKLTDRGTMVFYGRSDATLNPGGVRIGTADIYKQVEKIPEVLESLVVGKKEDRDEKIVLFVKLNQGATLNDELIKKIKLTIKEGASPFHIPKYIFAVPDLPRTRSGKITEIAVKNIIAGKDITNVEALANPEALEYFKNLNFQ